MTLGRIPACDVDRDAPRASKLVQSGIADAPLNELGIKGVGETGVIPMTAAIACRVDDALVAFRARVVRTPILPQAIVALSRPTRSELQGPGRGRLMTQNDHQSHGRTTWHLHVRDGAMLMASAPLHRARFRPRHSHAEPRAARADGGGRRGLSPERP